MANGTAYRELADVRRHDGNYYRPSWKYCTDPKAGDLWPGHETAMLEMMESTRNVLERIHGSQMLQCDIAQAIKDLAKTLRRIDRRLAKLEGAKLIK